MNVTVLFAGSTIPPSALKVTWYSPASYLATKLVISVPITYVVFVITVYYVLNVRKRMRNIVVI